ncbi:asparaginase [Paraburkholderia ginsengiterrae]|uniref:Asparaginase n=1 Tax=Paraburkholderia ginsengiterrae TaxID=1462993 RepID=A0A1A9N9S6_9BURK|nr:asparaginase [Paraburkholderia ginsengiterrae]OAJ61438.1 asparaginase [Paraburkholderia ginsengiterrae]OAJ62841.1 asparaginase [Paraburkholderia ginsengiterrae]
MSLHEIAPIAPIAATVYRGDSIENTHLAHVAIVDASGRLLASFGDPSRMTLARSAAKPAQALAVLETGALERFGFDEADLALMCASHSSEPRHIERTRQMLAKAQASEADLRCGGHPPLSDAVYVDWLKRDFKPGAVCSNCSGKHAGMLAGARSIGAAIEGYELPGHPLQVRVKHTVAQVCDLPDEAVQWATDGCNLPTPAFPLDRLARLFAKLAASQDAVEQSESQSQPSQSITPRTAALARIYRAMAAYPELVGGEGRFCTELMRAFDGALIGKVGADGSYAIGVRASRQTEKAGANGALGIAVKVEDGNVGILYAVAAELLRLLDIGTAEQRAALASFHAPRMLNTMGVEIGRLAFSVALKDATGRTQ